MNGEFPGLKTLLENTPTEGAIGFYTTNAAVYRWNEAEKLYVEVFDEPQEHFIKYPGESWRKL